MQAREMNNNAGMMGWIYLILDYVTLAITSSGVMSFMGGLESFLHVVLYVVTIVFTVQKMYTTFKKKKDDSD